MGKGKRKKRKIRGMTKDHVEVDEVQDAPAAGPVGSDYWSDPRVREGVRRALEMRQHTRPLTMDLTRFMEDE